MLWRDNFTEIQHDQTPLTFTDWLALAASVWIVMTGVPFMMMMFILYLHAVDQP